MEDLEPWNMFTNDFLAEDNREILPKDIIPDQTREIPVKPEPIPFDDDDENGHFSPIPDFGANNSSHAHSTMNNTNANNDDEDNDDDNAIFNFGLEPQVDIAEPVKRSTAPPPLVAATRPVPVHTMPPFSSNNNNSMDKSGGFDEKNLNFEAGVIYICPACGTEFSVQNTWKHHMNTIHNYSSRKGLNFVQIDKLYHQCLECQKRIAMHSMENLLKHKFTHLPFRCVKCKVCLRQYKYRQDLIIHLRMTHREDLINLLKAEAKQNQSKRMSGNNNGGYNHHHNTSNHINRGIPRISNSGGSFNQGRLEIKDIKENAIDIYGNTDDNIEVKNELMDADGNDILLPSFLEDGNSNGSSATSDGGSSNEAAREFEEGFQSSIQYICPECSAEYGKEVIWRQHIEMIHDFGTAQGLNFHEYDYNGSTNAQCLECKTVLFDNKINMLQEHKFTHLPQKRWLRCKICFLTFTGRKEIKSHYKKLHGPKRSTAVDYDAIDDSQDGRPGDDDDDMNADDSSQNRDHRDPFESQIDYLCPQCGKQFLEKKSWRKHVNDAHQMTDLQVLNFKVINERQVACLECDKIITNAYGVQNAQQHRITHMPHKAYIRCRQCRKAYTDRKGLVKHLRSRHRVGFGYVAPIIPRRASRPVSPLSVSQRLTPSHHSRPPSHSTPQSQAQTALPKPPMNAAKPQTSQNSPVKRKQKEIVRQGQFTYEIQYLDDDDDALFMPELSLGSSFSSHHKCVDCGSIFSTKEALQTHISEEHEFLDFNELNPNSNSFQGPRSSTSNSPFPSRQPTPQQRQEEEKDDAGNGGNTQNDDNELLIPTGNEDASFAGEQESVGIEQNFLYLCPSCGVEFKTQNLWRRHINEVHGFDKRHILNFRQIDRHRYRCKECHDVVSNPKLKGLQDHKFRHLPYKLYIKCLLCGTCYNHKPNMVSHLRVRHNIIDTRDSEYEYGQPQHSHSSHHQPHASSQRPTNVSNNVASNQQQGSMKCVEFAHNAVDHETITYFCPQCNQNFETHASWRRHIVDAHNLNNQRGLNFRQIDHHHFLCLQCYKRVTVTHTKGAIGQLQSHKFRHLPYKSFKCRACDGEFVRKQMFFKHLNKETNLCDAPKETQQQQVETENIDDSFTNSSNAEAVERQQKEQAAKAIKAAAAKDSLIPTAEPLEQPDEPEDESANAYGVSSALIINQDSFLLACPQCEIKFEIQREWREHINSAHDLGNRRSLNIEKIGQKRHQCLECGEQISGNKLRDLQIHKFKHLPHGAFIHCKFCTMAYYHIGNMKEHLKNKHPNVVQRHEEYAKMEELQRYEEISMAETDVETNDDDNEQQEQEQNSTVAAAAEDDGGGDDGNGDDGGDDDEIDNVENNDEANDDEDDDEEEVDVDEYLLG